MATTVGLSADAALAQHIGQSALRLTSSAEDYAALDDLVGGAQIVLLGEATHGTKEFYRERAVLTQRLITEHGFNAVAIEGDWPDAQRVNQYVKGDPEIGTAMEALQDFQRFPTWMWCNREVLAFIEWLYAHNADLAEAAQTGFYGLDLYSLHSSMSAVIRYLQQVDPEAAKRAQERYACFEHFGFDPQRYAYATAYGAGEECERDVIRQLLELRSRAADYSKRDGRMAADAYFFAEQNAKLVKNAEEYYRLMFDRSVSTWNLRDRHMAETLEALLLHLGTINGAARAVVWAHNSHVGNARATEMGARGEFNIGQLLRERYADKVFNLGFTTYNGTVTAASDWDQPGQRKRVRPALSGSYERLLHDSGVPAFLLKFDKRDLADELRASRLERAIGVVYRPETERVSHYFLASLPQQFDAVLHFDHTQAVEPLDLQEHWQVDEAPETYPFGM